MWTRRRSSRFVLWAAAFALLLKAAVPMLASAAAHMQGKSVAEICTVYGVALPGAAGAHEHHHHHAVHDASHDSHESHDSHALGAHGGDHCALSALAALALPDLQPAALPPAVVRHVAPAPVHREACARDDCGLWVARQKQGPPAFA